MSILTKSLSTSALAITLALSGYAQDAGEVEGEDLRQETVTVTGSRLAGTSDSGAIAVSILTDEELAALGETSTGDLPGRPA